MTNKSSLSTGLNGLKRTALSLTIAAMLATVCHAEFELPQSNDNPAVDPSQTGFLAEADMQPQSVESPAVPEPAAEPQPPVDPPTEPPAPIEAPVDVPPLPAEDRIEAPAEAPPATETPAPEAAPAIEETPQDATAPQFSENPIISTEPPETQETPQQP